MNEWRQRRVTASDIIPKEEDDCYLAPDDPARDYMNPAKFVEPQIIINNNNGSEKARIMREQNIKPGTDEWFKLWFKKD